MSKLTPIKASAGYAAAVACIEKLPVPPEWRLGRMRKLLREAGISHSRLRFVHVTGSNGKGSVCAGIHSILRHSGFTVGLYTSPHLADWRERFVLDGKRISERDFARLLEKIERPARAVGASQFEVLTAMALAWFSERKPDWVVWEVGLGGRLDATNVVNAKHAVITSISLEHTDRLGNTLREITREKSKVIKRRAVVVTPNKGVALEVIAGECGAKKARLVRVPDPLRVSCTQKGTRFDYGGRRWKTSLLGFHQAVNASTAIAFARSAGIPDAAIAAGLKSVAWPGRMQVYSKKPLVVLDGGHNPAGISAMAESFVEIFGKSGKKPVVVMGVMKDKDWRKMVRLVARLLKPTLVVAVAPVSSGERSLAARKLADEFASLGVNATTSLGGIKKAVGYAKTVAREKRKAVLVTGSLYAVGEFLASAEETNKK